MPARLERDVQRCTARTRARGSERVHFGVRFAESLVMTLADDLTIIHDDGADHRIGRGLSPPALGERERATHQFFVARIRHRIRDRVANRLRRRSATSQARSRQRCCTSERSPSRLADLTDQFDERKIERCVAEDSRTRDLLREIDRPDGRGRCAERRDATGSDIRTTLADAS